MLATMPEKRTRMIFDIDEQVKWAIGYRALNTGESPSDIAMAAFRAFLTSEMEESKKRFPDAPEDAPKPKRGRPKK